MQAYIAKRGLLFIPTVVLVTILVFVILRIVPGDPALLLLAGEEGLSNYSEEQLQKLRAELGTDKPIYVQYVKWVGGLFRLDFGDTFTTSTSRTPVSKDLKQKFPITLELTIMAVLMASIIAVPLGVLSAVRQDTIADYATRIITIAGIALPNFWVGIMMIFFLVRYFGWFPPLGYADLWEDPWKNLQQLILPAIALGFSNMAFVGRMTRSTLLEVFREDYIRTARSKGLAERVVIYRHALKNALLPVITVSGAQFGVLLGGTVIIEQIFLVPGIGRSLIVGVNQRDYATVQAIVFILTVAVLVVNMALDLVYAWLNPRIRYT
jgi:peptide/nickel transport system permease protein